MEIFSCLVTTIPDSVVQLVRTSPIIRVIILIDIFDNENQWRYFLVWLLLPCSSVGKDFSYHPCGNEFES